MDLLRQQQEMIRQQQATLPPAPAPEARTFVADIETRKRMGTLLREGNCEGAINEALFAGDFQLAEDVRGFCEVAPAAEQ